MLDKRMLIVPAELIKRIDENRGDMSQVEFIELLIDSQLNINKKECKQEQYVTKNEFDNFEQGIRDLLRSFLDFFLNYGLELTRKSTTSDLEELSRRLQEFSSHGDNAKAEKIAEIKWK